ncbi:MAG: hypothetical protein IPG47_04080 [Thermoflexaceae bacterium]|nr:hypothetical protein [Thermoflexaceae bacterium]
MAHPLLSERTVARILHRDEPGITFDAIELANPSPTGRATAAHAARHNRAWRLPVTGSSDAHHLPHVGTGWTEFDGTTASALLAALSSGATVAVASRYPALREVGIGQTLLGLAWGYSATPRKMLRRTPMEKPQA